MSPIQVALAVFGCILAGIALGMGLRHVLPQHHLHQESKDAVKLGAGLIATLTALVLGLLIASAKASFDAVSTGLMQGSVKIVSLDRVMAQYGPETNEARRLLRRGLAAAIAKNWPEDGVAPHESGINGMMALELMQKKIRELGPQDDLRRSLQARASAACDDLAESRWQVLEEEKATLPMPFLIVVAFWLTILFASFSLYSPRNITVTVVFVLCALSASGAIFLLLEMNRPGQGTMKASSAPLLHAYRQLQQADIVRPTTMPSVPGLGQ